MSRFAKGGECLTCIRLDHDCWNCKLDRLTQELRYATGAKKKKLVAEYQRLLKNRY